MKVEPIGIDDGVSEQTEKKEEGQGCSNILDCKNWKEGAAITEWRMTGGKNSFGVRIQEFYFELVKF